MAISRRELIRSVLTAPVLALPAVAAQSPSAGKPPRLKITNIESYSVAVAGTGASQKTRYAVTRVYTDGGVTGTSFLGCPKDVLEGWVKPTLVGEDLFAIDKHLKRLQMQRG